MGGVILGRLLLVVDGGFWYRVRLSPQGAGAACQDTLIRIERPLVRDGDFADKWIVSGLATICPELAI
jgi:hypothetical protein